MVEKHETMFLTIGVLACQILGIVGSQIETKRIFSLVGILTNLRRCHLQSKNLEKLILWRRIDCRVGCKSPSNLLELIEINVNLEEELEQFKKAFERDEIVDS
jgi:hypothetical protein